MFLQVGHRDALVIVASQTAFLSVLFHQEVGRYKNLVGANGSGEHGFFVLHIVGQETAAEKVITDYLDW